MTVAAIMLGLLPALWATRPGAEVIRRIAVPMVGRMISSRVLTLLVIPVLYFRWRQGQLRPTADSIVRIASTFGRSLMTGVPLDRTALVRRGLLLNWLTIGYNSLEAVVSLAAGVVAGSVALVGFGMDSVIEVTSSVAAR